MKRKNLLTVFLTVGLIFSLFSQPAFRFKDIDNGLIAQNDTGEGIETQGTTPRIKSKKKYKYNEGKSPMVAAGLSLLVPGAGEFYGRDYIRSGIFFGIEVAMLSMWYYNESDGDDKKDEYRAYADANFEEDMYYAGLLGMTSNMSIPLSGEDANENGIEDYYEVWNNEYFGDRDNWTYEETDALAIVDLLTLSYGDYNGLLLNLEGGAAQFTHNLPSTKTQQYYEMVGKYHQFACGWNDFNGYVYEDGQVVLDSIIVTDPNGVGDPKTVVVPRFKTGTDGSSVFNYSEDGYDSESKVSFYENLRDETNKAYEMGQNFLMITLVNHVASAFDASYVIKSKYQIDTQIRVENNDKSDQLGLENFKVTYSVLW